MLPAWHLPQERSSQWRKSQWLMLSTTLEGRRAAARRRGGEKGRSLLSTLVCGCRRACGPKRRVMSQRCVKEQHVVTCSKVLSSRRPAGCPAICPAGVQQASCGRTPAGSAGFCRTAAGLLLDRAGFWLEYCLSQLHLLQLHVLFYSGLCLNGFKDRIQHAPQRTVLYTTTTESAGHSLGRAGGLGLAGETGEGCGCRAQLLAVPPLPL